MSCGEHVERDEELGTDLGDVVQSLIAEAAIARDCSNATTGTKNPVCWK